MPKDTPIAPPEDPMYDHRLRMLESAFLQFAATSSTENVIGVGFGSTSEWLETVSRHLENISAQMAPLVALTKTPPLSCEQEQLLEYLIAGWRPPDWRSLTSLSFDTAPVKYIGDDVPGRCDHEPGSTPYGRTAS